MWKLSVLLCAVVGAVTVFLLMDFKMEQPCGIEASSNLIHHNPWLVFLEYYKNGAIEPLRCGGTLISKRHVITAAHCVKRILFDTLVARLGEYDLTSDQDCVDGVCADPVLRIKVAKINIPEGFDGKEHDVAVLELSEDAPYSDFIRPICLPTGTLQKPSIFTAAGWGELTEKHFYSHIKKIIPLPYWTNEECRAAYKYNKIPKNIVCAGGQEGIDTCRGDSGGPLALNNGQVELWGVTSLGNSNCGAKGYPGIYTSVTDHLEFINMVLNQRKLEYLRNKGDNWYLKLLFVEVCVYLILVGCLCCVMMGVLGWYLCEIKQSCEGSSKSLVLTSFIRS